MQNTQTPMRVKMRQLLSRKSHSKLSEEETRNSKPGGFLAPGGEHALPPRTSKTRENGEMLSLFPNVNKGVSKIDGTVSPPTRSSSLGSTATSPTTKEQRIVSERSRYMSTKEGPPRVLAGNGTDVRPSYRRCEDEPIRTPGAIQSYGALVGVKYSPHGNLEVRIASENTRKLLGYGPEQLFALTSFLDVLKAEVREEMVARINYALNNVAAVHEETRLDIFQMIITFPYEPDTRLWCAIHLAPNQDNLIICEFEAYSDAFYLKDAGINKLAPETPIKMAGFETSPSDFEKSTTSASRPLPAIEVARQRQNKEFSALDIFNASSQAQKQITACRNVQEVRDVSVGIIAELTGFHRVMFYTFDNHLNGCVDSELLNPNASQDVFRGMHYPSHDIPKQARELYITNRVRILQDRGEETSRLVARNEGDFGNPLDLTHAYLRAMSPVHNKYLENMGVRSSMSISIVIDSALWGLIACHGYGDIGLRVSLPIRELCRSIGDCAAVNIERLTMIQRIQDRKMPTPRTSSQIPFGSTATVTASSSADFLQLVDADFGVLSLDGKIRAIGTVDPYEEAVAILTYLQSIKITAITCSHSIKMDFPNLSAGLHTIAGFLMVPMSTSGDGDFMVFFRKNQLKHVKWAGDPYDKAKDEYLQPRGSFQRWGETVSGMSKEWTEDQLDTSRLLAMFYGRFVEVWRKHGALNQKEKMASIRTTSQEARTPIDAITTYLETALANNKLDNKTREILDKAHRCTSSLNYVMEDLSKLTEHTTSEEPPVGPIASPAGPLSPPARPVSPPSEAFNLKLTASKVFDQLKVEKSRKGLSLNTCLTGNLPAMVKGDGDRFSQVLVYFINNAFRNAHSAKVEVSLVSNKKDASLVGLKFSDSGPGMSESELDDVFQEFSQAQDSDSKDWRLSTSRSSSPEPDLPSIAQYVQDINGQISVSSELGSGTIFNIELPFDHYPDSSKTRKVGFRLSNSQPPSSSPKGPLPSIPPPPRSPIGKSADAKRWSPPRSGSPTVAINGSTLLGIGSYTNENGRSAPSLSNLDGLNQNPVQSQAALKIASMHVLIAEDDPISSRMLDERLTQWGHTVDIACDGQEAYDIFAADTGRVDVILMDLKMPFVDGILSTRMIRFLEKEYKTRQSAASTSLTSPSAGKINRVPIIAVSANLDEDSRVDYIQHGFDGWMLKPLDFKRLDLLLQGVKNLGLRRESLYVPGQSDWKKGGWFLP